MVCWLYKIAKFFPKKISQFVKHFTFRFYAKRCFLLLMENMAKQVITIQDKVIEDCFQFLNNCEKHGKEIKAIEETPLNLLDIDSGKNTVTYEARVLKYLLIRILR